MKRDYKKIYWTITMLWGAIASLCCLFYAIFFDNKVLASIFWNLSYWTVAILIVLSLFIAIGFSINFIVKGFIDNPQKQIRIIVSIGALILIMLVSYILASGNDIPKSLFDKTGYNYNNSKLIGGSIYTVYFLLTAVVLVAFYTEIAKKFK
jgi:hypothetical protein